MQFVVLSDVNANDYVGRVSVPIFRDPSVGRAAWKMMTTSPVKHDTFVFSRAGVRTLFWDARVRNLANWESDIREAVQAAAM